MVKRTKTKVIESAWIDPPDIIRQRLKTKDGKVLRIEKIRHIEGDPWLRAERTAYDLKGNPVQYVSVVYRAD